MATIVIHAGMPKTGSTSIQRWIVQNASRLREQHDTQVLVASRVEGDDGTAGVRLEPYQRGRVNSGPLIKTWHAAGRSPVIARKFIDDIATFGARYRALLVTAEALSQAFWQADDTFLLGFEELARDHEVRVAYYVRPQHTAIEATWREAGYKSGCEPSKWVLEKSSGQMHYLRTLEAVRELAPNVAFELRPFRSDLLDGGGPIQDFARRFLAIEADSTGVYENRGLRLELVNVLRHAPAGWFWSNGGETETYRRRNLRAVFDELAIVESPRIRRSRLILQQHCHEVFEPENEELAQRLAWPAPTFVPRAEDLDDPWDIAELDTLWAPEASEAERALFYSALRAALGEPASPRHGAPSEQTPPTDPSVTTGAP